MDGPSQCKFNKQCSLFALSATVIPRLFDSVHSFSSLHYFPRLRHDTVEVLGDTMRLSSFTGSSVARALILFLVLLLHLTLAVDPVVKRDPEAVSGISPGKGWNVYIGTAKWNNDPKFLTDTGAFIAFAKAAFTKMRDQARADGVSNPPSALTVLIVGNKAYISSSITKTERGGDYKPGNLLKLFRQPLYEQETLDGPTPPFGLSQVLSTLHRCLEEATKEDSDATEHQMFCGEPVALEQYFNDAGLPGSNQKDGMRNAKARIVTWGVTQANQGGFVFKPCSGPRNDAPNAIGCLNLVTYLGLPYVSGGNPSDSFPPPDSASEDRLCLDDGDL